jgi:osomolarity two-component system response regulator SKN7
MEMENRVLGLEDRLAKALDEVREARSREVGMVALFRDVIGHLAAVEKGECSSSGQGRERARTCPGYGVR